MSIKPYSDSFGYLAKKGEDDLQLYLQIREISSKLIKRPILSGCLLIALLLASSVGVAGTGSVRDDLRHCGMK